MDNLSTEAAADICGVPASTLRYWRSTRNPDAPASFMIGRRVFYRRSDIEAWVQEQYAQTVTGRKAV